MNIFVIDVAHTVPWHTVRVSSGYRRLIPKGWTQYIRVSRQCPLTSSWYGDISTALTLFCLLFRLSQPYSKHSWRRVITRHEMRNHWHWCQILHPPRYRVAPGATWSLTTQQILFPTIHFYRHFTWPTLNTEKHGYVENRIARWWCFQLMNYFELWNTQSITTWIKKEVGPVINKNKTKRNVVESHPLTITFLCTNCVCLLLSIHWSNGKS